MKNRVFSFLPRFSILLLFLGMVIGEAYAQSQTITGVVKDQTGEPLIGVNVMERALRMALLRMWMENIA